MRFTILLIVISLLVSDSSPAEGKEKIAIHALEVEIAVFSEKSNRHPAGYISSLPLLNEDLSAEDKAKLYFLIHDAATACRLYNKIDAAILLKADIVRLAERNFTGVEKSYRRFEGEVFLGALTKAIEESPEFEKVKKTKSYRMREEAAKNRSERKGK